MPRDYRLAYLPRKARRPQHWASDKRACRAPYRVGLLAAYCRGYWRIRAPYPCVIVWLRPARRDV